MPTTTTMRVNSKMMVMLVDMPMNASHDNADGGDDGDDCAKNDVNNYKDSNNDDDGDDIGDGDYSESFFRTLS